MRRAVALLIAGALAVPATAQPPAAPPPPRPMAIVRLDPAFDRLVAPDAKVETLATIPDLVSEGPLWRKGKLQVSDQHNGVLYAVGLDGRYGVIARDAGGPIDPALRVDQGPNGQANWRGGTLLVARLALRDIGIMGRDGRFEPFLRTFEGKRFNSPNDMTVGPDGALWFTDPPFSLPGYNRLQPDPPPPSKEIPFNGVFRFKDGKLTAVATDMFTPNGIGLSPDGRTLYVANSTPEMFVRAWSVARDGTLSQPRELIRFTADGPLGRGAPDGLKVDSLGNVWTTGPGGVVVVAPDGRILGRIQLPARASNLAFGDDYRSLFITSGPIVYRLRTRVKGLIPPFTVK